MEFYRKYKFRFLIALVVLAIAAIFFVLRGGGGLSGIETQLVVRTNVQQIVEETGAVTSAQEADLSVEGTGRIVSIPVSKGSIVAAGDVLIQLDSSKEEADLAATHAQMRVEEAVFADLLANAEETTISGSKLSAAENQQKALIENAYRTLLSADLEAVPSSVSVTATPPVITGRYIGPEGQYKIIVHNPEIGFSKYKLRVFGLETAELTEVRETTATSLGTYGLFISFPDDLAAYGDTIWYINIPNTNSTSYAANQNAYIAAKEAADVAFTQTGISSDTLEAQAARVSYARATLAAAQIQLTKRTLRAPFAGVVIDVPATLGEVVTPASDVISLTSRNEYEITVDIPEDDIAFVDIGDWAEITFDAYDEIALDAQVVFISPSARTVDGVPVFEVVLHFSKEGNFIRAGLSADVNIRTEERVGVIAIPSRAVIEEDGKRFVRVMADETTYRNVPVVLGLRGEGGLVEIISGLEEGARAITFVKEGGLTSLKEIE